MDGTQTRVNTIVKQQLKYRAGNIIKLAVCPLRWQSILLAYMMSWVKSHRPYQPADGNSSTQELRQKI